MKKLLLLSLLVALQMSSQAQKLYFPPITGTTWETVSLDSLGWCSNKLDSLYTFLSVNNTKGFMVLKDGKIVLEKYFGTFTKDSIWYWASAAKTLTAFLVGKAQEEGFLSINDSSSKYLGKGWTNCTAEQEGKITIKNQLSMNSGLDDEVPNKNCFEKACLNYKAPVNTRWAYHNAPYSLLDSVIRVATNQTLLNYTNATIRSKIGMNGFWFKFDDANTYVSSVRSFARFGLAAQNNFIWNTDTLLADEAYKTQMVNTSQNINLSYGYLWWLNGKPSYMVPTVQVVIPGSYAPNAPSDMIAGIGKNGQIVSVSKREGLVMVRMGNPASASIDVPTEFCDEIWKELNKVICKKGVVVNEIEEPLQVTVYPNPANEELVVQLANGSVPDQIKVYSLQGKSLLTTTNTNKVLLNDIESGMYFVIINHNNQSKTIKFLKE